MKARKQKMEANHERMKVKMDVYQEKVDDGQKEVKVQVGSLSFRIDANKEEMNACLEKMKEKPEERMPVAVQEEVPKKEAAVENLEH
jgi:hypothetical protein